MSSLGVFRSGPWRSLAARWILSVSTIVAIGILVLVAVTQREMARQLEAESTSVMSLARHKAAERLDADILLVRQRFEKMIDGLETSLQSIANLRASQAAVLSRNDVRLAEEVGARVIRAGFTGAIMVDDRLRVIGADRTGVELVTADIALGLHDMAGSIRNSMTKFELRRPLLYRFVGQFDPSYGAVFLAPLQHEYGIVIAVPVLDDFMEPIGAIIAYRTIKRREVLLDEFSSVTRSVVALIVGSRPISIAGTDHDMVSLTAPGPEGLLSAPDLAASARCGTAFPALSICVLRPNAQIERFRDEILSIGESHFQKMRKTLLGIGLAAVIATMLIVGFLARRMTRPITEITEVVDRVARGEWRVEVAHADRRDEIGQIARAIEAMQVSLAERDRMRQEMVRIDAINQRRLVLDGAVTKFEDGMAVVMKDIADTVHVLSETNEVLDSAARQADTQAQKIRNASIQTASATNAVSRTTVELSRTIREIGRRIRNTGGVVHQSEAHARDAEAHIGEISDVRARVEHALDILQHSIADIGHLGLKASMDAAAAGDAGTAFAPLAISIGQYAARSGEATRVILAEMTRLNDVADGAVSAIGEVKGVLATALKETEEISVTVEEQSAATREIVDGLAGAANALMSLAEAVDHLRQDMANAHDASADFVLTARRIAEDAKSIDHSLRLFMTDVVA